MPEPLSVLIVDDSRVFRTALAQALSEVADARVAGSVWNGVKALEFLRGNPVDLVTLDVEMPEMGGLETLQAIQQLNQERPDARPIEVLLISAYTSRGAAVTIDGLERGAFDFIAKPDDTVADAGAYLRSELERKTRTLRLRRLRQVHESASTQLTPGKTSSRASARLSRPIRLIAIGVSTGGPAALARLLPELCRAVSTPIVIAQHMPAGFTAHLAASLARRCGSRVVEASDGQVIEESVLYIAPGNRHLLLRKREDDRLVSAVNDHPPVNGCRPSVDVLFRSITTACGAEAAGVILTGMGCDGAQGIGAMKRAGAATIAQDEATSVVWGMPRSAIEAGHIDHVLPLEQIASALTKLASSVEAK
jgi:two-component system chemotaxis response regulator CheB